MRNLLVYHLMDVFIRRSHTLRYSYLDTKLDLHMLQIIEWFELDAIISFSIYREKDFMMAVRNSVNASEMEILFV